MSGPTPPAARVHKPASKERPAVRNSEPYPPPFRRAFLRPRYWSTWLGIGVLYLLQGAPRRVTWELARLLGFLAWRTSPKRRRIVNLNLAWCFPALTDSERQALVRRYFHTFAHTALDAGLLWLGGARRLDKRVVAHGFEHIEAARAAGEGAILLTPHMLGLEFGAQAVAERFPTVGIVKPARNRLFDFFMARGRTRSGGRIYRRDQGMRPLIKACKDGELIYYLPDEDLGGTQTVVFAPFYGVPAATLTAMPRLTRMCRAKVFPLATWYRPETRTYEVRVFPPLAGYPSGDDLADATRMNQAIEAIIDEAPEQYMWSLRLFQTRPNGAPSPYNQEKAAVRPS